MQFVTVELYNRMGRVDETFTTVGTWTAPRVSAQNYYQVNQNVKLTAIITINTDEDTIAAFDSIAVKGKKLRILAKSEPSFGTQRLECGV